MDKSNTYSGAGVDIQAGYEVVSRIKKMVGQVQPAGVIGGIGSFGGLFAVPQGYRQPVLVSGCDGVGTKILIAREADLLETIGIDLVAMSVNDVAAMGAKPLFFLDYLAVGRLVPDSAQRLLQGVVAGCQEAECALLGGETAEMPGVYEPGEFDLAGFAVGIVDRDEIITGATISAGDLLIGLPSSGLHSNGFSLVRKICFSQQNWSYDRVFPNFEGSLAQNLLTPTKIYVRTLQKLLGALKVKGIAHITGGGLPENLGRIIPEGLMARVEPGSWPILPIFELLAEAGEVGQEDMYATFNMGIGLVLVVSPDEAKSCLALLEEMGESAYLIGSVQRGEGGVRIG